MPKKLHFASAAAYKRWLAYGNIHHVFKHSAPYPQIFVKGKKHKVKHRK